MNLLETCLVVSNVEMTSLGAAQHCHLLAVLLPWVRDSPFCLLPPCIGCITLGHNHEFTSLTLNYKLFKKKDYIFHLIV